MISNVTRVRLFNRENRFIRYIEKYAFWGDLFILWKDTNYVLKVLTFASYYPDLVDWMHFYSWPYDHLSGIYFNQCPSPYVPGAQSKWLRYSPFWMWERIKGDICKCLENIFKTTFVEFPLKAQPRAWGEGGSNVSFIQIIKITLKPF